MSGGETGRPGPGDSGGEVVLQRLVAADPVLSEIPDLLALAGPERAGTLPCTLPPGGAVRFDGWVNLFDPRFWQARCRLDGLALRLAGRGRIRVELLSAEGDGPRHAAEIRLGPDGEEGRVDLSALLQDADRPGADPLALRLVAPEGGRIDAAAFVTGAAGARPVRLAIAITTFRREAAAARTADRICAFLEAGAGTPGAEARLFVIDNGRSLDLPAHPRREVIPNRNLGGAGGFARGLAAAEDWGASHALFMDDDASMSMENLVRTIAVLRLARSGEAAVAGAMISTAAPDRMWEYGAVFHRFCRPLAGGTDLTDAAEIAEMERAVRAGPVPRGFYGGFWYFAFPLAAVRHWPFPFFVRGDDISFSLANPFDVFTLPGVMSLQEDFAAKESPLTLYLDLRNHLHHHLVQDGMEIGRLRTAGIALRFLARSVMRMHYDSAEGQCLAWEDVMRGPGLFLEDLEMAGKRGEIARLTRSEAWAPSDATPPDAHRPPPMLYSRLCQLLLNGHIVPFWRRIGRRARVGVAERGLTWPLWGAAEVTMVAPGRAYRVVHDKARFAAIAVRATGLTLRWLRAYPRLREVYRESYPGMTSRAFWEEMFAGGTPALPSAPPAPGPFPREAKRL